MAGTANDLAQTFAWNPGSQIVNKTSSNAAYDWNPLAAFTDSYSVPFVTPSAAPPQG